MTADEERTGSDPDRGDLHREVRFPNTRWSLVAGAGATEEGVRERALSELCRLYWYPVYGFARSRGCDPHRAEDLTQDLFLKFLRHESFAAADREKGKLRTYLLTSMSRLLSNEIRRANSAKRAPEQFALPIERDDAEARLELEAGWAEGITPDRQFDRRWAQAVLRQVEERLGAENEAAGKREVFDALRPFISGDGEGDPYTEVAQSLGMKEGAVKVAVHRLRKRFKMVLRDEIAQTVNDPALVDEELGHLWDALAR